MKVSIPIQEISTIEIELLHYHVPSDYYNFSIRFGGITKTEINTTQHTIKAIHDHINKIIEEIKINPKG